MAEARAAACVQGYKQRLVSNAPRPGQRHHQRRRGGGAVLWLRFIGIPAHGSFGVRAVLKTAGLVASPRLVAGGSTSVSL